MANKLPDIYLFNPTCEYGVANGNISWQPNRLLQKMELDLATLPLFFSQNGDFVLTGQIPSSEFLESFKKAGLNLPDFVLKKEALNSLQFLQIPKNRLLPWGWNPATHKLLAPLKPRCSTDFLNSPVSNWKPEHRHLYSRKFALGILKQLIHELNKDFIIPNHLLTEVCTTQKEIEALINRWGKIMVKVPWSSSGRGLQPVTKTPVHPKVWEKILGIVKEQGYAMVEPLLNKVLDLAFQFELKNRKVTYLGISNFFTNQKGQYEGNHLNGLPESYPTEITEFARVIPGELIQPVIKIIESSDLSKYYEGNFGVDTLIFIDEKNKFKINPCLEINVRQNMGLLSLHLEKLVHPAKKGVFRTFYRPGAGFLQFKNEMEKKHPLIIAGNKIESGFFPVTEAFENTLFGAYILV